MFFPDILLTRIYAQHYTAQAIETSVLALLL